jgi:hypothetical protein
MEFKELFRPISDVEPGVGEQPIRTEYVAKFCLGCSHKQLLAWLDRHPAPRCWGTGQDLRLARRIKRDMKIFMGLKPGKVA